MEQTWKTLNERQEAKSKQVAEQVGKQRDMEEKAIQTLTDLIKKETSLLAGQLHVETKLSDKLSWRGFKGYGSGKEKSFNAVWPTDEEWLSLSDSALEPIELTYLHFNTGTNVEALTMQLNNKFEIMQHPPENNFKQKQNKELTGHIRRVEMVARKKNQMISSIRFLDAEKNEICSIQGSKKEGEEFVLELGETEFIVGCRQLNNSSLRDIEFRILDKSKLGIISDQANQSTMSSFDFVNTSGVKQSAL